MCVDVQASPAGAHRHSCSLVGVARVVGVRRHVFVDLVHSSLVLRHLPSLGRLQCLTVTSTVVVMHARVVVCRVSCVTHLGLLLLLLLDLSFFVEGWQYFFTH